MPGLLDAATAIMSSAERRVEVISQNIANIQSPGYKAKSTISITPSGSPAFADHIPQTEVVTHFEQGKSVHTDNMLDLAVEGPGAFLVRKGEAMMLTRNGAFIPDADGLLVNGEGMVLQQMGGGDVVVEGAAFLVTNTGLIIQDGQSRGEIGLYEPEGTNSFVSNAVGGYKADNVVPAQDSIIRQGMRESSNVVMSDEMIEMMAASRMAESGAQVTRAYDQLIGQAVTTFGRVSQ